MATAPTTLMLSALQLNNQGVALLLERRDEEAVPFFSQSLGLIKSRIGNYTDKPMSMSSTASSTGEDKASLHEATFALPNFEDARSFLYMEAFTFSADCEDRLINESNSHVYSAVVLFNLALVYHRQGKTHGKAACLVKAERMYEIVNRLLLLDSEADNQATTALHVKLATLNNLSLLQHEQHNYESAQTGFQLLLAWTIRSAPTINSMIYSSQQMMDVHAMLLNVLFGSVPSIIAPAA
jgi:tetratricopeptide (TPR) repeat protein